MSNFRGTSIDQDSRFFNQNKKLMAKMTFPSSFKEKVDMKKINKEVMEKWIAERITELLGYEDEIVVSLAINLLEPKGGEHEALDPRELQMSLTGFLGQEDAVKYMEELWALLLSAQNHSTGIPTEFLEKKKEELRLKKQVEEEQSADIQRRLEEIKRQTLRDVSSFTSTRRRRSTSRSRSPRRRRMLPRRRRSRSFSDDSSSDDDDSRRHRRRQRRTPSPPHRRRR